MVHIQGRSLPIWAARILRPAGLHQQPSADGLRWMEEVEDHVAAAGECAMHNHLFFVLVCFTAARMKAHEQLVHIAVYKCAGVTQQDIPIFRCDLCRIERTGP